MFFNQQVKVTPAWADRNNVTIENNAYSIAFWEMYFILNWSLPTRALRTKLRSHWLF